MEYYIDAMKHSKIPTPPSLLTDISRFDLLHYLVLGDADIEAY